MILEKFLLTRLARIAIVVFCSIHFTSCNSKEEVLPDQLAALMTFPQHFPETISLPNNPLTRNGIILGRQLFFEKSLSGNNTISCATCHEQRLAFSDGLGLTNRGISGNTLHRNTPALINLAWSDNGLFWDGGASNLESISIGPITHLDEMGLNILDLPDKLNKGNYNQLFEAAFPEDKGGAITTQNTLKALAQYMRTLNSANSRYDQFILNPGTSPLSDNEIKGLAIFDSKCSTCHTRTNHLFTDNQFHNIGLDSTFSSSGEREAQGRFRITFKPEDIGKFKTPTLRNLAYTAPYMHDGRFTSLQEVLNHFANGVLESPTLAASVRAMKLSIEEQALLLDFLDTLNDDVFTKRKDFQP